MTKANTPILSNQNLLGRVNEAGFGMCRGIQDFTSILVSRRHNNKTTVMKYSKKLHNILSDSATYILNTLSALSAPDCHCFM
jgi:hypothetical protein